MKSKNKRGRPRTNRKPVLVRLDHAMIKQIDHERKNFMFPKFSRPEMIRHIIWGYFRRQINMRQEVA